MRLTSARPSSWISAGDLFVVVCCSTSNLYSASPFGSAHMPGSVRPFGA